ncbi:MAG: VIT and VWA domain-containing protein [Candidatus Binatia bacterium]|nr:VIT and VWA domain-containing protein [Candidatus Binatia bacterium]
MFEDLHAFPVGAPLLALLLFGGVLIRPSTSSGSQVPPPPPPGWSAEAPLGLEALGPDGARLGPCPLEHTDVQAEIAGFVTRVRVKQTFSNPFEEPIEAVYTFPLSSDGAVDAMTIRAGERTISGDIRRREEARKIYEDAKSAGKLAALLDEERPNIFTQSIANLMPGESIDVEIQYVESLDYADGRFEFSFPMVVGPRFVPGAAAEREGTGWSPDTDRVTDASRVTPPVAPQGVRAGHDVSLSVELAAGLPIADLRSRLHEVDVEEVDGTRRRVRLRNRNEIPNRDFVLEWTVAGEQLASGVLVHRPEGDVDGYVTFLLVPPERVAPVEAAPREIVFVVDRSGSQSGKPLAQAKAAILYTIGRLNPRDTFQLVSFSSAVEKLFDAPRPATAANRRAAKSYVEALQANGGTMMAEAVREVCADRAPENRLRIVSFMTDGYVGNDHEVLGLVQKLRGRSRWFPFGTGNSTNRYLLDHMARVGGGEVEYVLLDEDPEAAARRFYDRIAAPVLTDVRIDFEGLAIRELAPHRLPDLWAHKPLIVHARYTEPGAGRVVLRGFRQGEKWERALEVELPARSTTNAPIASMWARARVDELLALDLRGLQRGEFVEAFRDEVVSIALAHHLLTPFTSFVAVEEKIVNEGGKTRTVTVPVEVPDGVDRGAIFVEVSATMGPAAALAMAPGMKLRALGYTQGAPAVAREEERYRPSAEVTRGGRVDGVRKDVRARALLSGPGSDKLGRLLVAQLEEAPENTAELSVRVTLTPGVNPEAERALAKAGLRIGLVFGQEVVGTISVADLEALVALGWVERVDLA